MSSDPQLSTEDAATLLRMSRELLEQGQAGGALQLVVSVITALFGQDAILPFLARAKDSRQRGVTSEDLARLLLDSCRIVEDGAGPSSGGGGGGEACASPVLSAAALASLSGSSIVGEEQGRTHLFESALGDGSSYVCSRCNGLVKSARRAAHEGQWCPALASGSGGHGQGGAAASDSNDSGDEGEGGLGGERTHSGGQQAGPSGAWYQEKQGGPEPAFLPHGPDDGLIRRALLAASAASSWGVGGLGVAGPRGQGGQAGPGGHQAPDPGSEGAMDVG